MKLIYINVTDFEVNLVESFRVIFLKRKLITHHERIL